MIVGYIERPIEAPSIPRVHWRVCKGVPAVYTVRTARRRDVDGGGIGYTGGFAKAFFQIFQPSSTSWICVVCAMSGVFSSHCPASPLTRSTPSTFSGDNAVLPLALPVEHTQIHTTSRRCFDFLSGRHYSTLVSRFKSLKTPFRDIHLGKR